MDVRAALRASLAVWLGASLICGAGIGRAGAAEAQARVSVAMPAYDSPGSLVPIIVTAWDVPVGHEVALDATAGNGASVTCIGATWLNPVRNSHSRQCYLQLPLQPGSHVVAVSARISFPGEPDDIVEGESARAILADGNPSPGPMSIARAQLIERCWNGTESVWLTIDDGINAEKLRFVTRVLERNNVRARFFLTGRYAEEHPNRTSRIRRAGHLLGNHGFRHAALTRLSDADVMSEIERGVGASQPRLLRPAYGAGALSTRLEALAAQRSYRLCRWTTVPYDWEASATADVLVERIHYGDYRTPPIVAGGVILLHGHGNHTLEALQSIIDTVRAMGLEFEPLTD